MTSDRPAVRRRREARRAQILDTAMQLVVAEGFPALTMPRLARELDSAVGALYRYFTGKDDLILGLQHRALVHFEAFLVSRLDAARQWLRQTADERTVDERAARLLLVARMADLWLEHAVEAPTRHQLMDAVLSSPQLLLDEAQALRLETVIEPILTTCTGLLAAAEHVGAIEPGDASVRMHLVWAGVHGLGHLRKRERFQSEELHVPTLVVHMLSALLRGFGAPPSVLSETWALRTALLAGAPAVQSPPP